MINEATQEESTLDDAWDARCNLWRQKTEIATTVGLLHDVEEQFAAAALVSGAPFSVRSLVLAVPGQVIQVLANGHVGAAHLSRDRIKGLPL